MVYEPTRSYGKQRNTQMNKSENTYTNTIEDSYGTVQSSSQAPEKECKARGLEKH